MGLVDVNILFSVIGLCSLKACKGAVKIIRHRESDGTAISRARLPGALLMQMCVGDRKVNEFLSVIYIGIKMPG